MNVSQPNSRYISRLSFKEDIRLLQQKLLQAAREFQPGHLQVPMLPGEFGPNSME
jgi:hypothetical protein